MYVILRGGCEEVGRNDVLGDNQSSSGKFGKRYSAFHPT